MSGWLIITDTSLRTLEYNSQVTQSISLPLSFLDDCPILTILIFSVSLDNLEDDLAFAKGYRDPDATVPNIESGDTASSTTSSTPDPHAVSGEEACFYYAGIHSMPSLLYRTGKVKWFPPRGPEAYPRLKEVCEVFNHPIVEVWNHDLGWKVVKVLDTHTVSPFSMFKRSPYGRVC